MPIVVEFRKSLHFHISKVQTDTTMVVFYNQGGNHINNQGQKKSLSMMSEASECTPPVSEHCVPIGLIHSDNEYTVSQQSKHRDWQIHKEVVQLIWNIHSKVCE